MPHQPHVELNLIRSGLVTYLHGGSEIKVGAGRLTAFWAAIPYQITEATRDAMVYNMTLPLTWFLQFRLPEKFTHSILGGQVLVEPEAGSRGDFEMFERWIQDLEASQPGRDRILLLEVEARLLRFANCIVTQDVSLQQRSRSTPVCDLHSADRVQEMVAFIADNYSDPITVDSIGKSAGLHPNYAMTLFRRTLGTTLINYVTRYRVSHAQHLLATTDCKVVDVALQSGFNSLSRFNEAFRQECGCPPRDYRNRCQADCGN